MRHSFGQAKHKIKQWENVIWYVFTYHAAVKCTGNMPNKVGNPSRTDGAHGGTVGAGQMARIHCKESRNKIRI